MNCADCKQKPKNRCHTEGYDCLGGKLDLPEYTLAENRDFQNISDSMRSLHNDKLSRLEEIIRFSQAAGFQRLGLAFCIGMAEEAELVAQIFKKYFRVESVCCKVAGLNKEEHGMARIDPAKFEVACNPIGQAKLLNRASTDLNVQLGLCLGHDILLQKYATAPVTVLAVKDRALANNPLGAVYCSYWRKKLGM